MGIRADRGFTLTELLVAVSLLLAVLAMSYGALSAIYSSRAVSDRQALMSREVGAPLAQMDEVISQNMRIESPSPYGANFLTDQNNDNIQERHIITAGVDGTLQDQVWLTNAAGANTTLVSTYSWSTHNANRARTVPLFRYYGASTVTQTAQEITVMSDVPDETRLIIMTVMVDYDGRTLQDSRQTHFRNR